MIAYIRTPDPGSHEARRAGCSCPINQNAEVDPNTGWPVVMVSEQCSIHYPTITRDRHQLRLMAEFQSTFLPTKG